MKHTYIFLPDKDGLTEDDLYRLVRVTDRHPVSWKGEMTGRYYTRVQVFTFPGDMHRLAHAAGFSGEQLRIAIPAARQRGDVAVQQAQERLANLSRPLTAAQLAARRSLTRRWFEIPITLEVRVKQLRAAGCEISIVPLSAGFEARVFGESFIFDNSWEAYEFLRGLEKGFTSAPLWSSIEKVTVKKPAAKSIVTRRSKRSC